MSEEERKGEPGPFLWVGQGGGELNEGRDGVQQRSRAGDGGHLCSHELFVTWVTLLKGAYALRSSSEMCFTMCHTHMVQEHS